MPKNLPNPKVCVPHEAASDKHVDGGSVRTPPLLRQSPIDKHIRVRQRIGSAVGCCAHACLVGEDFYALSPSPLPASSSSVATVVTRRRVS